MASNPKKPHLNIDTPDNSDISSGGSVAGGDEESRRLSGRDAANDDAPGSDSGSSSEDSNAEDSDVDVVGQGPVSAADREIQVEFEARSPQECDYFGLVHLLKQMLRSSSVNLSDLADRIIAQRTVGSVITQTQDDDESDEDGEDENAAAVANGGRGEAQLQPNNEVFGVGTILKLVHGPGDPLGDSIVSHMLTSTAGSEKAGALKAFFNDETKSVGFLISERILNMPPQISVPLYETLLKEIRKAVAKNLPFNFTHYVLISRLLVSSHDDGNVLFTNAEEEVFVPECDLVLDVDCGVYTTTMASSRLNRHPGGGGRMFNSINQDEYVEKRKLLVFKAHKLEKITALVKGAFPIN